MSPIHSHFDLRVDYAHRDISVSGEFDAVTAPVLAAVIDQFHDIGPGDITIRLDAVTFMDVAGIGAIAAANRSQFDRGSRLLVKGASVRVRRVFGMAHCVRLLGPLPSDRVLQMALDGNRRIGIAVGIIMDAYCNTDREALHVLARLSRYTNREVRDLAEEIILTGDVAAALSPRTAMPSQRPPQ